MRNFAFVVHPVNSKRDVERKFPLLGKILSESAINFLCKYFPPVYVSRITGIVSHHTGEEIGGWFIACPLTPRQMMALPRDLVYKKIIQTGKLAQRLGADVLGLGGFTSVVGDGGITVAQHLDIPVTTGDSYTVAVAVEGALQAAHKMNINPAETTTAVVGATGSIGRVCAFRIASRVKKLRLIGRRTELLHQLKQEIEAEHATQVEVFTDLTVLQSCDIVLTVTNAIDTVIESHHLKPGSVVCDVARPRDVSLDVMRTRNDVLVIEGGTAKVPGPVEFNFRFGLPPNMAFACMAETMTLALEGDYSHCTLGKNMSLTQVDTMYQLATKHGFRVTGFRSAELALTDEKIAEIHNNAQSQFHWANP